jgi:hypothetical protein
MPEANVVRSELNEAGIPWSFPEVDQLVVCGWDATGMTEASHLQRETLWLELFRDAGLPSATVLTDCRRL